MRSKMGLFLAFLHSRSAYTNFGNVQDHYEHDRLVPDECASEPLPVLPVFAQLHRPPAVHHTQAPPGASISS